MFCPKTLAYSLPLILLIQRPSSRFVPPPHQISFPWAEQQIREVDTLKESVSILENLGEVTLNLIQIPQWRLPPDERPQSCVSTEALPRTQALQSYLTWGHQVGLHLALYTGRFCPLGVIFTGSSGTNRAKGNSTEDFKPFPNLAHSSQRYQTCLVMEQEKMWTWIDMMKLDDHGCPQLIGIKSRAVYGESS